MIDSNQRGKDRIDMKNAEYWKDNFIQQYLKNSRWQALQANIGEYNTNT